MGNGGLHRHKSWHLVSGRVVVEGGVYDGRLERPGHHPLHPEGRLGHLLGNLVAHVAVRAAEHDERVLVRRRDE